MSFRVDRNSSLTYAAQVQRQTEAQLVAGRLHPGDRLPSVRQLARQLLISRTTAERIHETLCKAMLVELRPRSGAFVAARQADQGPSTQWAHEVYDFLTQTVERALHLGIDAARLKQLIGMVAQDAWPRSDQSPVCFPLVATRDAYECMARCLTDGAPIRLVHVSPTAPTIELPRRARYILSTYYMRKEARRIAEALGCHVLCVRYNVNVLACSMSIPSNERRCFVTRDADNAETTRVFLASAYPEVPSHRYKVMPVAEWLEDRGADPGAGQVWSTITAVDQLKDRVSRSRLRVLHPLLAGDFIEELRCLALCG